MSVDDLRVVVFIRSPARQSILTTAEDILLAKLEWHKLGESERQLEDVVGIIHRQGQALDLEYVEHWVRELGLTAQWRKALVMAGR